MIKNPNPHPLLVYNLLAVAVSGIIAILVWSPVLSQPVLVDSQVSFRMVIEPLVAFFLIMTAYAYIFNYIWHRPDKTEYRRKKYLFVIVTLLAIAVFFLGVHVVTNPLGQLMQERGEPELYKLISVIDDEIAHGIIMACCVAFTFALAWLEFAKEPDPVQEAWERSVIWIVSTAGGIFWGYSYYSVRAGWLVVPLSIISISCLVLRARKDRVKIAAYPWSGFYLTIQTIAVICYFYFVYANGFAEFSYLLN